MASAAVLFCLFVEERPTGEYKILIDGGDVETPLTDRPNMVNGSQLTDN
jgi:hypothetical protein